MEKTQIIYRSTRSSHITATASEAILQGIAPDGGLFVPDRFPEYTNSFDWLAQLSYREVAYEIMRMLLVVVIIVAKNKRMSDSRTDDCGP